MGQNRKLPSKKNIVKFWNNNYNTGFTDDCCWACGFGGLLDRAHLKARTFNGEDKEYNIVLLCRFCHHTQENISHNEKSIESFKNAIIDGLPFFSLKWNYITEKIKVGLYDNVTDEIGVDKNEFLKCKQYLINLGK
jgi:hypothetical protein